MVDLTKCEKSKAGNVITPKGRLCYPNLFRAVLPQNETNPDKARFQTSMVFPKGADLSLLVELVEETAVDRFGPDYKKKYRVKKPFLKTEDHPKIGVDPAEYPVLIRTNTPTQPNVVNGDRRPAEEADAYAGRHARLSLRCYAYDHPSGGRGVSFGLQNVQLLDHDEPLAAMRPPAEDEFAPVAVEGGDDAKSTDSLFE